MKKLVVSIAAIVGLSTMALAQNNKAQKAKLVQSFGQQLEQKLAANGLEASKAKALAACMATDLDKNYTEAEVPVVVSVLGFTTEGVTVTPEQIDEMATVLRPKLTNFGKDCVHLLQE